MVCDMLGKIIFKAEKKPDVDTSTSISDNMGIKRKDMISDDKSITSDDKKLDELIKDTIDEIDEMSDKAKEEIIDEIIKDDETEEGNDKELESKKSEEESSEGKESGEESEEESSESLLIIIDSIFSFRKEAPILFTI